MIKGRIGNDTSSHIKFICSNIDINKLFNFVLLVKIDSESVCDKYDHFIDIVKKIDDKFLLLTDYGLFISVSCFIDLVKINLFNGFDEIIFVKTSDRNNLINFKIEEEHGNQNEFMIYEDGFGINYATNSEYLENLMIEFEQKYFHIYE